MQAAGSCSASLAVSPGRNKVSGICGRALSPDELTSVAKTACSPANFMDSEPFAVTPAMVSDALVAADTRGRELLAGALGRQPE
jgi:hypothetical protein